MNSDDSPTAEERVEAVLAALEMKDAAAAAREFAPKGVFTDPRYPDSEYRGREEIREAFEWAFTNLTIRPAFSVQTILSDAESCMIEVESTDTAAEGHNNELCHVFVVDIADTHIGGWRTYLPYTSGCRRKRNSNSP